MPQVYFFSLTCLFFYFSAVIFQGAWFSAACFSLCFSGGLVFSSLFFSRLKTRRETKNRPLRVSDNKNIKISLKAQAHFSGFNDCKHTGKYKILYAFSAFVQ